MYSITSKLDGRGVIKISGPEKVEFLQGLVTNDVRKVNGTSFLYSAFLNAQGRFMHDLFITEDTNGDWLIDCNAFEKLFQRLNMYKLKRNVGIEILPEHKVFAAVPNHNACEHNADEDIDWNNMAGIIMHDDPRIFNGCPNGEGNSFGKRIIAKEEDLKACMGSSDFVDTSLYDLARIKAGLGEAGKDIIPEKSIILEYNFDRLNAIDWQKGCYIGQELIARTHYRGGLQKRLLSLVIKGDLNSPLLYDNEITDKDGNPVGKIKTFAKEPLGQDVVYALAMVRLSVLEPTQVPEDSENIQKPFIQKPVMKCNGADVFLYGVYKTVSV